MSRKLSDKEWADLWAQFRDNITKATPVDLKETPIQKAARISRLEGCPEEWFAWHFPNFYTSVPAPFHLKASHRVLNNPEWYEVRSWSRELAKSSRTMMEVLYLVLTGQKHNVLMVSSTFDNACRLLLPYKTIFEANNRIIHDYGIQQSVGNWESSEFIIRKKVAFRAIGSGQPPRGSKNDAFRPDVILIDDIDTDEECRNPGRIKQKVKWIEEALIPTRSVSNPLLIIACGNIIAKYCCITEMAKNADKHDVINLEDKYGDSSWPEKNSPENIARIKATISYNAYQKEYCNNPVSEGDVFKELTYGPCPALKGCEQIVVYADPATSNKDKKTNAKSSASSKAVVVVGYKALQFFVYKIWLDQTSNSKFVDWLFEAYKYLLEQKVDTKRIYIENNSLQDPFYEQVIMPLVNQRAVQYGFNLPITPDTRSKPDKYFRIEGTLEPLNRLGNLIFNEKLKNEPNMQRMHDQMLGVCEESKTMDGPDGLEGAAWIIINRQVRKSTTYRSGQRTNRRY